MRGSWSPSWMLPESLLAVDVLDPGAGGASPVLSRFWQSSVSTFSRAEGSAPPQSYLSSSAIPTDRQNPDESSSGLALRDVSAMGHRPQAGSIMSGLSCIIFPSSLDHFALRGLCQSWNPAWP